MGQSKHAPEGAFGTVKEKKKQKETAPSVSKGTKEARAARTESHRIHRMGRYMSHHPNWKPEEQRDAKGRSGAIPATRITLARLVARALTDARNTMARRAALATA